MKRSEIKSWLEEAIRHGEPFIPSGPVFEEGKFISAYLGTYMDIDPCGKYHHTLSPNGITRKCCKFWDTLEEVAGELGGWIESGEGDPCDTYFVRKEEQL